MAVGSIVSIVVERTWLSVGVGVLLIALAVWTSATWFAVTRVTGDAPPRLTITREGVSSPWWALRWEAVRRAWIGRTGAYAGSLPTLFIEPMRASDVAMSQS